MAKPKSDIETTDEVSLHDPLRTSRVPAMTLRRVALRVAGVVLVLTASTSVIVTACQAGA